MAIKSFGLFWRRDEVNWNPGKGVKGGFRLLGRSGENLPGLRVANFREQLGIYILYGNHGPYYVGLTKKGELARIMQRFDGYGALGAALVWLFPIRLAGG
jgi:hypothetical protein